MQKQQNRNQLSWLSYFKLICLIVCIFSTSRSSAQLITDNLEFYVNALRLDSYNGSGNNWNDLSGNNYDVRLYNTTFDDSNELFSKHLEFNGTSSYGAIRDLNYNDTVNLEEISVFAWVRTEYDNGLSDRWDLDNWAIIDFDRSEKFQLNVTGSGNIAFSGYSTNRGGISEAQYFDIIGENSNVNDGNWHYIGFTYSVANQKITLYLDGQIDKEYTANGNLEGDRKSVV